MPIRSVYQFEYTDLLVFLNWYTNRKQRNSRSYWLNLKLIDYMNGFFVLNTNPFSRQIRNNRIFGRQEIADQPKIP